MKKEYSIGEICKIYNLGADSLRYYEKKGLIFPKRKPNGYRVYNLEDIWRLNIIKDLRKLDFSVEQIKEYLDNRNIKNTIELMEREVDLIKKDILPLINLKNDLENKIKLLKEINEIDEFEKINIKTIDERKIIFTEDKLIKDEEVDLAFRHLEGRDDSKLFLFANKDMGVFISPNAMKKNDYTKYDKAFFFVDNDKNYDEIIPKGIFITLIYKGHYSKSQIFFKKIMDFINENNYIAKTPAVEIYRLDIHGTNNPNEYITEIQVPIKKTKKIN